MKIYDAEEIFITFNDPVLGKIEVKNKDFEYMNSRNLPGLTFMIPLVMHTIIIDCTILEEPYDLCICTGCKLKNDYAEPNQPDGTYVCRDCRGVW